MKLVRNIIICIFLFFLFSSLIRNIFDYRNKVKFYQEYKKAYDQEQKQNISLHTEILKKTDPRGVEKTIRNKLNLLKPGEVALMLPSPTPTSYIPVPAPLPNWQQWWNVFMK